MSIKINNMNMSPKDFHNAVRRFITNCNKCEYIYLTEQDQSKYEKPKPDHRCKLHNKRILHQGYHPSIIPCVECDGLDFKKRSNT